MGCSCQPGTVGASLHFHGDKIGQIWHTSGRLDSSLLNLGRNRNAIDIIEGLFQSIPWLISSIPAASQHGISALWQA